MAEKTIQGVAGVFDLLGLPVPDRQRLERIANDSRSYTQVRNDLLWYIANQDPNDPIDTAGDALASIVDDMFAAAGINDAGTAGETEEERLARISQSVLSGDRTLHEVSTTIAGFGPQSGGGGTVDVGGSTIPAGGRLIRVRNPQGSDARFLYFVVYDWRGVEFSYEVGDEQRFRELFGSTDNFDDFTTISQARYDDAGFVDVGSIDSQLGATESLPSTIERDLRALGMEDLPDWLRDSPQALALVGEATAQEWSVGRLWTELSKTATFQTRFGGVLDQYLQENVTIGQAVDRIIRDEGRLRDTLRPYLAGSDQAATTQYVQDLIANGWTAGAVSQVLEQAETLARDPNALRRTNLILEASGLDPLDEVGYINALNGFGPQDTIEALNTASAAEALDRAGIELDEEGTRALLDLVDTSDRILTVESFGELAQQLSFNLIKNRHEIDIGKLGVTEDDLIAAAFGRESPSGRAAGETLGLLARLERDRRAAAQGFDQSSGFIDDQGRLRVQGLAGV